MKMIDQISGKKYSYFVNALLFVFPIVINLVKVAGDLVLVLLALAGIFIAISHKISPFSIKDLKLFSWITFGYFLLVCVSILFSGKALELAHYASRELAFLFAPFIGLAIYKAKVEMRYLLLGLKVGLIVVGIIIINQYLSGAGRPTGSICFVSCHSMNAEEFGNVNVVLMFLAVSRFFDEGAWSRVLTLIALSIGGVTMVLNSTRGAWLVFLALLIICVVLIYKRYFLRSYKAKIALLVAVFVSVAGLGSIQIVQDRTNSAINGVIEWSNGDNVVSSAGLRLEMWKTSIGLLDELPLTGYGYRNTNEIVAKYAHDDAKKYISSFNHLHNDYLNHLIAMGFLGLVSVLVLLFLPLKLFITPFKLGHLSPNSIMGVFLCLSYSIVGLTTVVFGGVIMNALYVLLMAILMPVAIKESHPS